MRTQNETHFLGGQFYNETLLIYGMLVGSSIKLRNFISKSSFSCVLLRASSQKTEIVFIHFCWSKSNQKAQPSCGLFERSHTHRPMRATRFQCNRFKMLFMSQSFEHGNKLLLENTGSLSTAEQESIILEIPAFSEIPKSDVSAYFSFDSAWKSESRQKNRGFSFIDVLFNFFLLVLLHFTFEFSFKHKRINRTCELELCRREWQSRWLPNAVKMTSFGRCKIDHRIWLKESMIIGRKVSDFALGRDAIVQYRPRSFFISFARDDERLMRENHNQHTCDFESYFQKKDYEFFLFFETFFLLQLRRTENLVHGSVSSEAQTLSSGKWNLSKLGRRW